uniref:Uncharacterized protein n=1 Tax=Corethron hystrix TaxID=216773 RepID=A0A7S1BZH3_9STRA|mmetsp:Transcript_576/g.1126  ORF Transcript_576/g.1126 Transcript_576/m.1126 type:complete len:139 (+) Transcript_576:65-481(+)
MRFHQNPLRLAVALSLALNNVQQQAVAFDPAHNYLSIYRSLIPSTQRKNPGTNQYILRNQKTWCKKVSQLKLMWIPMNGEFGGDGSSSSGPNKINDRGLALPISPPVSFRKFLTMVSLKTVTVHPYWYVDCDGALDLK